MRKYLASLLLVPLLLTGCTSGADNRPPEPNPNDSEFSNVMPEEVEGSESYTPIYKPISTNPETWKVYADLGSTLPSEDPSIRTITAEEYNSATDPNTAMRVTGDIAADAEATAANITGWAKNNMEASVEDIPEDLIINRYPTLVGVDFYPLGSGEISVYFQSSTEAMVGGFAQTTILSK